MSRYGRWILVLVVASGCDPEVTREAEERSEVLTRVETELDVEEWGDLLTQGYEQWNEKPLEEFLEKWHAASAPISEELFAELHFRGLRGEGDQVLEERPQFAVVGAVRQSGQEFFSQHFSRNRTPPVRMRGTTALVVPRTITAVTQLRLFHVPTR